MATEVRNQPDLLANAASIADRRGLHDFPIVDVDAHHYEFESWRDLARYVEKPSLHLMASKLYRPDQIFPAIIGDQRMSGRLKRDSESDYDRGDGVPPLVHRFRHANRLLGIDYSIVFPTQMLNLALHPQIEVEKAMARAYARWMTERVLPEEPGVLTMLYLPFNDADASLQIVEEFGETKGVVGFLVTGVRYTTITHNRYMKVYRAIEERGMPLAIHPNYNWQERAFEQVDTFLGVHALGFPFYNMIQLTNIVVNGLPERFPKLRFVFIEGGISYLVFLAHRLDNSYRMRRSEAPLLKRLPSEYMREFYYTTQPLEFPHNRSDMQYVFDLLNGENQFLYASDYPHWDFDPPNNVYDLPYLSEAGKRKILGGTAMDLFRIEERKVRRPAG